MLDLLGLNWNRLRPFVKVEALTVGDAFGECTRAMHLLDDLRADGCEIVHWRADLKRALQITDLCGATHLGGVHVRVFNEAGPHGLRLRVRKPGAIDRA